MDSYGDLQFNWAAEPDVRRKDRPRCGARTRAGCPCKAPAVWDRENDKPRNGRCKLHGGLSTGPKTAAGREAIRKSNRGRAASAVAATVTQMADRTP